jgi:hypothetical protein
MADDLLHANQAVSSLVPLANDRSEDKRKDAWRQRRCAFKLNPLAMIDLPKLHSQKRDNPQSLRNTIGQWLGCVDGHTDGTRRRLMS